MYHPHLYAIIIGAILPVPFWLWRRRYPNSWVKWVSTPVVLNGVSWIPPATGINYSSWFMVGFMFQYIVRKRNFAWWSKFNYVLSSALDSGESFFFFLRLVVFLRLPVVFGGDGWLTKRNRHGYCDHHHLFHASVPQGRDCTRLVGEYGVQEQCVFFFFYFFLSFVSLMRNFFVATDYNPRPYLPIPDGGIQWDD
jgi:OPT oligopeptide transporter protein